MGDNYNNYILEHIEGQKLTLSQITIGSIQSYLIADTRGNLRDGFVRIHDSESAYIEYEATFELFNTKKNAKEVVDISRRLYNEGIVYPYFMVFSRTLKLWVVCYERFTQYNFHGIPLYEDVQNLYLSTRWKEIIRDILNTLQSLQRDGMSHGSLLLNHCYVEVHGRIKLFKPMNNYSEQNMTHDLTCLAQFLHDFLNPHTEWDSFSEALCVGMEVFDLLQHPFIANVDARIQIVYAIHDFLQHESRVVCLDIWHFINQYDEHDDWKTRITNEPGFMDILNKGNYVDEPRGLIYYMRNVLEHNVECSSFEAENMMTRLFGNYLGTLFTLAKKNDPNGRFMRR